MRLDDLKRYGIPGPLLAAWRERQGDLLLPLQSAAALGGLLSDRRDTLIAGPTSSGKSFCGELALSRALIERRKGAFVVPLKSIAEEKFAALEPICRKLKLRVVIATADHPQSDGLLESGKFDIAICVYEKFNRLLLANIDILATLSVVVIDELQLVWDTERGRVLESLLIKLRGFSGAARAASVPRLVGLVGLSGGAVGVPGASSAEDELAAWLNLRLIRETTRPRDLRQGVVYDEEYVYRSFNTGLIGREPFQLGGFETEDTQDGASYKPANNRLTDRLLGVLRRAPGQKLVFLSSRAATMRAAFELAAVSGWPRATNALDSLAGEEPSSVTRSLAQTLTRGVAFHSADLTALQRRIVEEAYRAGEIQVIFSTTTLALGVNLPAETVFVEPQKYCVGPINGPGGGPGGGPGRSGRGSRRLGRSVRSVTGMFPLPVSEFASIAGRAGRYRADYDEHPPVASVAPVAPVAPVARAALLAETEFERDILWETYIEPRAVEPLVSAFAVGASGDDQWASLALELIVSGLAGSRAELEALLANSLVWRHEPERVRSALGSALARLTECELIVQEKTGKHLSASAVGRAGVLSGLSIAGIERFVSAARESQPVTERQWLASALSAPDLERAAGSRLPRVSHFAALRRLFADAPDEAERLQQFIQPARFGPGRAISASALNCRLATLAALELWRSGCEGRALESETQLAVAQIAELGRTAGWLLGALVDIRAALEPGFKADEQIQALRRTLRVGLPASVAALDAQTGGLFNRAELMALDSLGCASAADSAALPENTIVEALSGASLGGAQIAKQKLAALKALLSNRSGPGAAPARREEKHMMHTATLQTGASQTGASQTGASQTGEPLNLRPALRPVLKQPVGAQLAIGLIPCRLTIDGAPRGERFLVTVDGLSAPLTGKSFKYLAKLACARLTTPEGWVYKDDIEQGFNQARYLYRMRREIEAALPGYNWPVYENNRLGYYRLRLDPQALEIDIERIAASNDYEVAALAESLGAAETLGAAGAPESLGAAEAQRRRSA